MRVLSSLRARLTAWYAAVLAVALVLYAALLYGSLSRQLYAHHDEELTAEAAQITALLAGVPSPERMAAALDSEWGGESLVLVLDASGGLVYRSSALRAGEPALPVTRCSSTPPRSDPHARNSSRLVSSQPARFASSACPCRTPLASTSRSGSRSGRSVRRCGSSRLRRWS